jgi:hypothetical protein
MPRHLPAFVVLLSLVDLSAGALAQTPVRVEGLGRPVSLAGAAIQGVVRDDAGQAISGVSVLAMGATLAAVRTDSRGRFLLLLAPGEYILRAVRDGYLSTVREAVYVHPQRPVERELTLTRVVAQPASATASQPAPTDSGATDHAHTERAWRLRHMTRSVLRDDAVPTPLEADRSAVQAFAPRTSLLDWVVDGSARAATTFFADTDFRGQVNFLTMGLVTGESGTPPLSWPQGSASVVVGAPVGTHGDWSVRAALAADDLSSWTIAGDYQAHASRAHAFSLGVSYSSQMSVTARAALPSIAAPGTRRVGGAYVYDSWRARSDVVLEYGLRVDRYDYLANTDLVSPRIGARLELVPGATIFAATSRRLIAPGADEFLPPATSGPWLPPQRTFSTLTADAFVRSEAVERSELGLEYALTWPVPGVVRVRRFFESVDGQIATLFGLDAESELGHYYVTTVGSPYVEAWAIALDGGIGEHLRGAIEYAYGETRWRVLSAGLAALPPGAQPFTGTLHDLTVSANGHVPRTSTRIEFAYRLNTHLMSHDRPDRPALGGRFNVEVRQQLPYQPIRGGTLDLVLGVRTLFGGLTEHASFHDELLTVAPPTRVVCGVQVGF